MRNCRLNPKTACHCQRACGECEERTGSRLNARGDFASREDQNESRQNNGWKEARCRKLRYKRGKRRKDCQYPRYHQVASARENRFALHCREVIRAALQSPSFGSALTLFPLCCQTESMLYKMATMSGYEPAFAAADCGIVSANWRRCYAVLCALRDSSGCNLVFIHRSGADRCNLFLGIGTETLATHYRAAFLLFAALAQHARRSGRIRGGEGEPPW